MTHPSVPDGTGEIDMTTFEETLDRLRPVLLRIAHRTATRDTLLDPEDRYQEMVAHLWRLWRNGAVEAHRPSYVLQNCRYALLNRCRALRRSPGAEADGAWETVSEDRRRPRPRAAIPDVVHDRVLVADMLSDGLSTREKAVVKLRREGLTLRETADAIGASHVWVLKLQLRIRDRWGRRALS
jgi:RNA polymerase sigma factor (sigma-70 family)